MAKAQVRHIDSKELSEAANAVGNCLKQYNETIANIEKQTLSLFDDWTGLSQVAFEKDYHTVYRQLIDLGDILGELYDILVDAAATFIETDEALAKKSSMSDGGGGGS